MEPVSQDRCRSQTSVTKKDDFIPLVVAVFLVNHVLET